MSEPAVTDRQGMTIVVGAKVAFHVERGPRKGQTVIGKVMEILPALLIRSNGKLPSGTPPQAATVRISYSTPNGSPSSAYKRSDAIDVMPPVGGAA